jgi:hypothetical protein
MTTTEILTQIRKMPLNEAREIAERLTAYLREQERSGLGAEQTEAQEDEFERYLLAKGVASHIPTRGPNTDTDQDFDRFAPIQVEGEPLSETIIRERR